MIEIWSKPNCVFCDKAEMLCKMKSLEYKKYMLDVDYSREDFMEKFPEARTFPQITMDGNYIGGFTELDAHLASGNVYFYFRIPNILVSGSVLVSSLLNWLRYLLYNLLGLSSNQVL